ncbi:hypothetical protein BG015_006210 [Linnemannia schmuckeri]|uniref:Galactose oxidase n=1 Tax=Linnemannia schmuckeri TaxID=64567 RepID=A0A9P5VBY4_9FUNG|nr:hypothetical protein BG015_006210 [Linnemannia schmuckeri]
MIPSLCSHCNGCRLRTVHRTIGLQRSKRKQQYQQQQRRLAADTPHQRLLLVATCLIISLSFGPRPIHAQQQQQPSPQPYLYKPRFSSGSAIANNRLYIVSGYVSEIFPSDAVGDTIFVSLDRPFSIDSVPWTVVKPPWIIPKPFSMNGTDATVVPTRDQSRLVFLGASGQGDPLAMSYDISADSWVPVRSDPELPRSAVGAALDPQTGAIIVQGGFVRSTGALSSDIDILSPNGGMDEWVWKKGAPTTALRANFQPIVAYLPTLKATLIIGGTKFENNLIGSLQQLDSGYLVTTSIVNGVTTLSNTIVNLTASEMALPMGRLSPCYTVLENGDLFMYGGATFSNGLNDAWILNARDLTWKMVSIGQNPAAGRAGATCQRISPDHIMIPQIGIIDTKQWVWTATYTPPRPGLPLGAIIGIIVGGCLLLGIALFFAGRTLWKRRRSNIDRKINRDSVSTHPLMGSEPALTNDNSDRFCSTRNLISPVPSSGPISSKTGSEFHLVSLTTNKDERSPPLKLPLLISPYPASTSYNSSSFSVAGSDSPERGSTPTWSSYKSKGAKSEVSLPESERLPQTMADMQYGYYVKTTQHNKQYEKRRLDLNRQQPNNGLNRKITSNQYAILKDEYHDDSELATAVLQLKDVEMGEESIMIPLQTLETGTILVSSHLDDQGSFLLSPTATGPISPTGPTPPMPMRGIPQRFSSVPSKAELDDDEDIYQPGVGGSITKLNAIKAAKAKTKAAEAGGPGAEAGAGPDKGQDHNQVQQQQQQQPGRRAMSPLSEDLISKESEVLVDNRRVRRP